MEARLWNPGWEIWTLTSIHAKARKLLCSGFGFWFFFKMVKYFGNVDRSLSPSSKTGPQTSHYSIHVMKPQVHNYHFYEDNVSTHVCTGPTFSTACQLALKVLNHPTSSVHPINTYWVSCDMCKLRIEKWLGPCPQETQKVWHSTMQSGNYKTTGMLRVSWEQRTTTSVWRSGKDRKHLWESVDWTESWRENKHQRVMKNDRDTSNYNQIAKPGKNLSYSDC